MEGVLDQITNYLLTQSWQIALLAAAIAAVSLMLKNKSAHVRYLLWLIVLGKCLVPPLLTIPLAILPEGQRPQPVATAAVEIPVTVDMVEAAPVDTVELIPAAEPTIIQRLAEITIRQWIGLWWIVGVGVFVLVVAIKALRTNQWLRRERKSLSPELQNGIENIFSGLGVETATKVWLIDGTGQPFVWGLLRGSIYLPGNFAKSDSPESQRDVLGHELSHILRFDAAVNLLQIIAQGIFWFHPFVWWTNKKIRAEREKCCDEMTIARLDTKAKDYSTAIINTLMAEHKSSRPIPSLAVAGPVKNIEERIKSIMKPGKRFYKRPSVVVLIAVMLLAALAVPTTLALTKKTTEKTNVKDENVPKIDSEQKEIERVESTEKLKRLGIAVGVYAAEHNKKLPDSLQGLKGYELNEQEFQWVLKNVEYVGKGKLWQQDKANQTPMAYDKSLLQKQNRTNVLFLDGHVELCHPERLKRLGILEEITVPKDWQEIITRRLSRQSEKVIEKAAANRAVDEQLNQIVDLSGLSRDMAFIEAIEELKHSVEPPLKIVELWGDLEENAEVHPETAIKIDGISGIRLRMGLELLLKSVSGNFAELGYVVKEGVIIIATKESLPSELETRVYDISDLLGRPAMYYQRSGMMMGGGMGGGGMYRGDTYGGGTGGGGMYGGGMGGVYGDNLVPIYGEPLTEEEKINRANRLIKLIQDTIEPESWYDAGGDGTIKFYENNKLIVLQTPEVHQKIRALLRDMRGSSGEAGIPIALKGKPKAAVTIESRFILLPVDSNKINSFLEKEKITLPSAKADPNYQNFLNAEQTDLLLRMTQAHREAKLLTAPKVTVFDGEEAALTVARNVVYFSGYTEPNSPTDEPQPKHDSVTTGTWIQITPKIEPDNENILVKVVCEISDIAGYEKHMYKEKYPYEIPMIQKSQLSSTYLAASGQTVLLGGQKVKAEDEEGSIIEKELLVLIKAEIAETAVF